MKVAPGVEKQCASLRCSQPSAQR